MQSFSYRCTEKGSLSHRKPASTGIFRGSCGAQDSNKRDAPYKQHYHSVYTQPFNYFVIKCQNIKKIHTYSFVKINLLWLMLSVELRTTFQSISRLLHHWTDWAIIGPAWSSFILMKGNIFSQHKTYISPLQIATYFGLKNPSSG